MTAIEMQSGAKRSLLSPGLGISIVVPVHNEEGFLQDSVLGLLEGLKRPFSGTPLELILIENGSRDKSARVALDLAERLIQIRAFSLPAPSYGKSLRFGIEEAVYPVVLVFNVDLWDIGFAERAVLLLQENDIVVGSKCAPRAQDKRAISRRFATRTFNMLLKVFFGFKGTDTHGMKAFRTERIRPIIAACVTERELFDTEIILRAERLRLRICELPVTVKDVRPTRYNFARRLPSVFHDMIRIKRSLRG